MLRYQIRDDLALVIANIHHVLSRSAILVDCLEYFLRGSPDLLYCRMVVYKME